MMEHHNYCGYALTDLITQTKIFEHMGYTVSANINKALIKLIKRAQKFVLPVDGVILPNFHETFNEADANLVRLPYSVIAVEYSMGAKDESEVFGDIITESSRRIALAFYKSALGEDLQFFEDMPVTSDYDDGIIVWPISYIDREKIWCPCWAGVVLPLPIKFEAKATLQHNLFPNVSHSEKALVVTKYLHGEYSSDVIMGHIKNGADPEQIMIYDTEGELQSIVSLCCALSCHNVELQSTKIAKRKATEKKSPKQLFEYKSLVLKPSETTTVSIPQGGTHASPRTHLRMGHWRHYKDGKPPKWINDMVVNPDGPGVVEKDYRLQ